MLEIHRRYVLDEAGTPIAVQIPIGQFEALLQALSPSQAQDIIVKDETHLDSVANSVASSSTEVELHQAVEVGLSALERGEYDDFDEAGLDRLFERIKQNGRSQRGLDT